MDQLTQDQAKAFFDSGAWKKMTSRERAVFQIDQDRLCMPFGEFHAAIEEALGRPVWTHEFGLNRDGLRQEIAGKAKAPTFAEILAMLPADKTVVVVPNAGAVPRRDSDVGTSPLLGLPGSGD